MAKLVRANLVVTEQLLLFGKYVLVMNTLRGLLVVHEYDQQRNVLLRVQTNLWKKTDAG